MKAYVRSVTALLAVLLLTALPATARGADVQSLLRQADRIEWSQMTNPAVVKKHLDLYLQATKADPNNLHAHLRACEMAYYAWRLETDSKARLAVAKVALAMAKKATQLDPKSAAAWYWLGSHYAVIGLTQGVLNSLQLIPEGKKSYDQSIALDPSYRKGTAIANLARVYMVVPGFPMSIGDVDKATQMLNDGYRANPDSTYFPLYLADLAWSQGYEDAALKYLQDVLDKPDGKNDYTILVNQVNRRKARDMMALIKSGAKRDRFNDVLSD